MNAADSRRWSADKPEFCLPFWCLCLRRASRAVGGADWHTLTTVPAQRSGSGSLKSSIVLRRRYKGYASESTALR